jgi:hypothetical protein
MNNDKWQVNHTSSALAENADFVKKPNSFSTKLLMEKNILPSSNFQSNVTLKNR